LKSSLETNAHMNNINRELIPQCNRCHKEIHHNDKVFKLVNDYQIIGKPSENLFFCKDCSFYKTLSFKQLFLLFLNSSFYLLTIFLISSFLVWIFGFKSLLDKLDRNNPDMWKFIISIFVLFSSIFTFLVFNEYEDFVGTHKRENNYHQ